MRSSPRIFIRMSLGLLIVASTVACVRLDEAHCIVNGGDFACEEDRLCAMAIEPISEVTDEGDGCILRSAIGDDDFERLMVYVQYGLPESLPARHEPEVEDLRSVTGVLSRLLRDHGLEDVCHVDESVVRRFEQQWKEVDAVRVFLGRKDRVRAESATLEPLQVEAIRSFGDAINDWLDGCEMAAMGG